MSFLEKKNEKKEEKKDPPLRTSTRDAVANSPSLADAPEGAVGVGALSVNTVTVVSAGRTFVDI